MTLRLNHFTDQVFKIGVNIKYIVHKKAKKHKTGKNDTSVTLTEPRHEKTGFLHMQKQRRRSVMR